MIRIGTRIRSARRRADISLRELARRVEASHSHLHGIESGERAPSEKLLRAICTEVGLDFDELARLGGFVPEEIIEYVAKTPGLISRLRREMAAA
jgi:transcriptional regulator with XRE-family HTH domain